MLSMQNQRALFVAASENTSTCFLSQTNSNRIIYAESNLNVRIRSPVIQFSNQEFPACHQELLGFDKNN